MKINSWNEWDTLEEVVIGIADYANWPGTDPVFAEEAEKTSWHETPVPSGPVPQWIIDEANQDLAELAAVCAKFGAVVRRPEPMNFVKSHGMYNYCPRDRLLIAGDTVVDVSMMYPCRNQESRALRKITEDAKILEMPKDEGLILDAANVCRLGNTWLLLESASGNQAAYNWLCRQFPDITIELCNFYAGVHIDSTIVPLREGLVLLNGSRVNDSNCPQAFKNWTKIYVDEVVAQGFYQYPYASKWIALNMLVLDPHTVIVDQHQTQLIQLLEQHKFTVVPLELRHSRTLGGGFHCVTLDTRRKHA
jgi:glycine amidinotransferase/scyllo-inosamine-4-phosphate amidinotransferase 1